MVDKNRTEKFKIGEDVYFTERFPHQVKIIADKNGRWDVLTHEKEIVLAYEDYLSRDGTDIKFLKKLTYNQHCEVEKLRSEVKCLRAELEKPKKKRFFGN